MSETLTCRIPLSVIFGLSLSVLRGQKRSFRHDSRVCLQGMTPPPQIDRAQLIPQGLPLLVVVNHYTQPGLGAWWLPIAINVAMPVDIHWVMTAGWTYPDPIRSRLFEPLTGWAFRRAARVYGFTAMPPMPPRRKEISDRRTAVSQIVAYAKKNPAPVIGLAPEGRDLPGAVLGWPPSGAGRLMLLLNHLGLNILPIGAYVEGNRLILRFGPTFSMSTLSDSTPAEQDTNASRAVMQAIAALLPNRLRGEFA